jgi:hypothetical protein
MTAQACTSAFFSGARARNACLMLNQAGITPA